MHTLCTTILNILILLWWFHLISLYWLIVAIFWAIRKQKQIQCQVIFIYHSNKFQNIWKTLNFHVLMGPFSLLVNGFLNWNTHLRLKSWKAPTIFLPKRGVACLFFLIMLKFLFFAVTMARKNVSTLLPLYWNVKIRKTNILTPGPVEKNDLISRLREKKSQWL